MVNPFIQEMIEMPGDPLGGASGRKRSFQVQFVGKTNTADFPFTVANELVAAQLGIALGLNIPSALSHFVGKEAFILSQRIGRDSTMQAEPQVTSKQLSKYVEDHPKEIHGAIIFDLLVANNDRAFGPERRNLAIDFNKKLSLYDYGNSCFYRHRPKAGIEAGLPRLDAIERDFGAMFDMDHKGNHYWEFLSDWDLVDNWCERIRQLPDFVVESAVARIPRELERPTPAERTRLIEFLCRRKCQLKQHIESHLDRFSGLSPREETQS